MARPRTQNPRNVIDATLTLRITKQDRELVQELVALEAAELSDKGLEPTAASYVRGLIRHEARLKGLLPSEHPEKRRMTAEGTRNEHSRRT